jgi:hypothetical protein
MILKLYKSTFSLYTCLLTITASVQSLNQMTRMERHIAPYLVDVRCCQLWLVLHPCEQVFAAADVIIVVVGDQHDVDVMQQTKEGLPALVREVLLSKAAVDEHVDATQGDQCTIATVLGDQCRLGEREILQSRSAGAWHTWHLVRLR